MSPTETPVATLDLVPLLLRPVSNQKICVLLELQGHIDTRILGKAMRYLLRHNPVLASELVITRGAPRWRLRANRLREAAPLVIHTAAPDTALAAYPATLNAGKGDTLEIRVYRGEQHDAVCVTTDHTAADAAGCREIVRQLSRLYTRLERGEQFFIPRSAASRDRDLGCITAQLGIARCLLSMGRPGIARPQWQFARRNGSSPQVPTYLLRKFDADSSGGLTSISRRYNATINDLLLAALFRALQATLRSAGNSPLPVQLTVDLRRYLPAGQRARIANLSGADCVWLRPGHSGNFRSLVADTHRQMCRIKGSTPGTGSSMWLRLLFALGFERVRKHVHKKFKASRTSGLNNPLLTNFGRLDGNVPGFGAIGVRHACITAPSLLVPGIVIGASSFRNVLTLSAGFDANDADPDMVGGILDRMISEIGS